MKRQCDTSFFYSLAELSKSHIFPSPFSPAFTQVIGHFAANFGQVGCLLPWPDPCCCCNGDSISTRSLGLFLTAFWGESCSEHRRGKRSWNMTSQLCNGQLYVLVHIHCVSYRALLFICWRIICSSGDFIKFFIFELLLLVKFRLKLNATFIAFLFLLSF